MKSWRFSILLVVLLMGGFVVNAWEYLGEAYVERKTLKDFPSRVASWEQIGTDEQFDSETLAVLRGQRFPAAQLQKRGRPHYEFLRRLLREPARRRHVSQSVELFARLRLGYERAWQRHDHS